ncbi:replicative DNA helicase [Flaviflexus salsibiostraticola]|uniref:Replicative DNA helicase n=1 Tax=Flaviflexus salsibiostraticola TaxID=1282737 RepID=A0A3S8ZA21_9ACTO|nr:replicative DNA helicase [Flaviflexus salsibiostraticola]AZN30314.1 replicative DNA helicase [Flaviflexus salsibiostraticola]
MSESGGFERTPPQNIEAEMSVLGGMLLSKDAVADVTEILKPDDFYRPSHSLIFEIIMQFFGEGQPADAVTVGSELQRRGELERVGGLPYLHSLVASVPTAANASYYATIVREQAQLRSLVEAGTRIVQLGYSTDGAEVDQLVNMAQSEVYSLTDTAENREYAAMEAIVNDLVETLEHNESRGGELDGIPSGFRPVDDMLNGFRGGQMIIVAARPGAGKSTFAMDVCRAASVHNNLPSVYFSLEMNRTELSMRVLAAESSVFLDRMIKGNMTADDWRRVVVGLERISKAPLIVDDSPNLTMAEIRAKCRRLKQQHDIQLIVIDYLQLLTSGAKHVESRQQEVSDFSRSIKLLAKELNVPIIAVAQLNRDSEKRETKKPMVSDLRESGSLEQDADVVILLHREDMYKSREEQPSGLGEVIVGKHRAGPVGSIMLSFQGHYARFVEAAEI